MREGFSSTYGVASEVVSLETVLGNRGAFLVLKLHEPDVTADMHMTGRKGGVSGQGMHHRAWASPDMRVKDG